MAMLPSDATKKKQAMGLTTVPRPSGPPKIGGGGLPPSVPGSSWGPNPNLGGVKSILGRVPSGMPGPSQQRIMTPTLPSSAPAAIRTPSAGAPASPREGAAGAYQPKIGLPLIGAIAGGASLLGGLLGGGGKSPTIDSAEYARLGTPGLQSQPNQAFYDTLLGNRLRAIESMAGGQRQAAQEALAARGIDIGTPLTQAYGQIGQGAQLAGQEAAAGVQALQFDEWQQARNFERQVFLERLRADVAQDRTPWYAKFFDTIGQAGGMAFAFKAAGQQPQLSQGTNYTWEPQRG